MGYMHQTKLDIQALTSRNASADRAPRVPPEKLSINRTQWRSSGMVVPPDVTHTIGRPDAPAPRATAVCR